MRYQWERNESLHMKHNIPASNNSWLSRGHSTFIMPLSVVIARVDKSEVVVCSEGGFIDVQ